jgi:hypothetical protein
LARYVTFGVAASKLVVQAVVGVLGSAALLEYLLPPEPIDVRLKEVQRELAPATNAPLRPESEFLRTAGVPELAGIPLPLSATPIKSLSLEVAGRHACRSFQVMYSARDLSAKPGEETGPALLVFPRPSEKAQPCVMTAPSG